MNTSQPNIVLITCHDLGQRLNCYGCSDVRSPNIDAFAASAVRFDRSFCTAPQCSPSRASLWTGRFPHANGVIGLTHAGFANDLHTDEQHLAQVLRAAGYETHLFGGQHECREVERCGHEFSFPHAPCRDIASAFVDFLGSRTDNRPLFAQIGFGEPHRPFPHDDVEAKPHDEVIVPPWLPDIPEVREDLSDCEASIASADKAFGRIAEAVAKSPIADNTVFIFTADHGIAFPHSKMTLYDPGIEIPFIITWPGAPAGVVRHEMISNIDVFPTLLDFVGLPHADNLHGRSFHNLLTGGSYTSREEVFAEKTYHTYYDPMRAIRTGRWKLIANFEFAPYQETGPDFFNNAKSYPEIGLALGVRGEKLYHPPFELFDLDADPAEQHNLADDPAHEQTRNDLARRLRQWMADTGDPLLDGPIPQGAYRQRMAAFKAID